MSEININNLAKKAKAIFDDDEDACIITKLSSYKSLIITASSFSSGFLITLEEHITDDDDDTRFIKIMSDEYSPSFLNLVIKEYLGRGGNPNLEPDKRGILMLRLGRLAVPREIFDSLTRNQNPATNIR